MNVAIIPARGGSKRIPRKNIRSFCGKPMIAWTIEAAKKSDCFDKIIVSTDDQEIADIARKLGADVPFMRPDYLSDDYTGTVPVICHAVEWFKRNIGEVKFACCLYATAPFIDYRYIQSGYDLVTSKESIDYAFTVTTFPFPIQRAIKTLGNGRITMFNPDLYETRSQDLEEALHDAGQFYWGTADAWLSKKAIFSAESAPIKLPRHYVQDIDTEEDWVRAEWLFKAMELAKG
ncbi:pseudaminic acid cytidylyltransferase [Neptuniibacter sp. QD34_54]|uniref:pseudaminic acid cytidylyltransferase n=1 Tax=Neptuniibacter sp. QD34_54 TaxID=3398208 RepID=UPI0039F56C4E